MRQLRDRVAVVTGAASGIGRALVDRFAAEGMSVVLADVEKGALDQAVGEVRAAGATAVGVRTDVSREEDLLALAETTMSTFGAVHLLCNIAGVEGGALFADISRKTWEWVMGVNFWGTVDSCRIFLPLLAAQDEAHIVNTASLAGFATGLPTFHPYVASKFAIVGLTENLEVELRTMSAPHVGVSLLSPGIVRTRMSESERNRPLDVPATDQDPLRAQIHEDIARDAATIGVDPAQVAELVVDAVRTRRFHIFTHPDMAIAAAKGRLEWMTSGVPPQAPSPVRHGQEAAEAR
jgi:NAD(P)-dependent dehydrogenase (short-subunit alcohol dehydrogenase family)